MAEPTLYLFDGYNLLNAGRSRDVRELQDELASFLSLAGADGVVVFDGAGTDGRIGRLEVRYAPHADALLERLAAQHRGRETVCLVSSDAAVRGTSGAEVRAVGSARFLRGLRRSGPLHAEPRSPIGDAVDEETRLRLERLRRGR